MKTIIFDLKKTGNVTVLISLLLMSLSKNNVKGPVAQVVRAHP